MKKTPLILLLCVLFPNLSFAVNLHLKDDDLIQYAQSNKAFNSVYKIELKPSILKRRSVASCVHIGEGVFVTDAHCLLPFSYKGERLKYKLFVSSDNSSFPIENIAIPPVLK